MNDVTVYAAEVRETGEPLVILEMAVDDGGSFTQTFTPYEARQVAISLCQMANRLEPVN